MGDKSLCVLFPRWYHLSNTKRYSVFFVLSSSRSSRSISLGLCPSLTDREALEALTLISLLLKVRLHQGRKDSPFVGMVFFCMPLYFLFSVLMKALLKKVGPFKAFIFYFILKKFLLQRSLSIELKIMLY